MAARQEESHNNGSSLRAAGQATEFALALAAASGVGNALNAAMSQSSAFLGSLTSAEKIAATPLEEFGKIFGNFLSFKQGDSIVSGARDLVLRAVGSSVPS